MAAEEAKDPKRTIPVACRRHPDARRCLRRDDHGGGRGRDWTKLSNINDPLPQAMKVIVGDSGWLHMLVWLACSD